RKTHGGAAARERDAGAKKCGSAGSAGDQLGESLRGSDDLASRAIGVEALDGHDTHAALQRRTGRGTARHPDARRDADRASIELAEGDAVTVLAGPFDEIGVVGTFRSQREDRDAGRALVQRVPGDRKSTRLNS